MKKQSTNILELALQAQITSVAKAKKKLEDAIQLAEDQHYAEIHKAEQARRTALNAAGKIQDDGAKIIEAAWGKVFSRSLRDSFSETRVENNADKEAIRLEVEFMHAIPFIKAEVPADLPGLSELLVATRKSLEQRRIDTGKNLSAAHDRSAQKARKEIPAAKRRREQGQARLKRQFERAKAKIDALFEKSKAKIDEKLALAKAAAQAEFEQTAADRKQAWLAYAEVTKATEHALLSALSTD